MWQCTTLANAQSIEGTYRGTLVCEKMPASPDILNAPLDVSVRGNSVLFARPLFNWNGTRVVGSELGTGTIDAEGKVHLTSSWYNGGIAVQGDYSGTLTKTGGVDKEKAEIGAAQRHWCPHRRSKLAPNNNSKPGRAGVRACLPLLRPRRCAIMAGMLGLTDHQLDVVMDAAGVVPVKRRSIFLERTAAH